MGYVDYFILNMKLDKMLKYFFVDMVKESVFEVIFKLNEIKIWIVVI